MAKKTKNSNKNETSKGQDNDNKEENVAEPQDIAEQSVSDDDTSVITISDQKSDDAKWYVVHTYSGHENKVASLLTQRVEALDHLDKFFKILIPHRQKIVVSEGKKKKVDERLFPGYIIVQMVLNDDTWYLVRSTRGVTGFVGTGTHPTPLPDEEVEALVKFMRTEEPKFEAKFSLGDSVKIIDGPFVDNMGKVDEVNEEQGKLKVLISVFGREVPVELDFMQVENI